MTPLWFHKSQALTAGHSSSMATSVFSWVIAAGHSSSMATAVLSWLVAAGHSFMLGRILIIGATCYRTWSFLSCLPAQQESDRTITSSVACDRQVMMICPPPSPPSNQRDGFSIASDSFILLHVL